MINTSHVDAGMETNTWRLFGIIFVTKELQLIDATFMYSLKQYKNVNISQATIMMYWKTFHHVYV